MMTKLILSLIPDYVPTIFSYSAADEVRQMKRKLERYEGDRKLVQRNDAVSL